MMMMMMMMMMILVNISYDDDYDECLVGMLVIVVARLPLSNPHISLFENRVPRI